MTDQFPRRCHHDKHTPAEQAITRAIQVVEEMGADVLLTDAVCLLSDARDKVADYVDAQPYDSRVARSARVTELRNKRNRAHECKKFPYPMIQSTSNMGSVTLIHCVCGNVSNTTIEEEEGA